MLQYLRLIQLNKEQLLDRRLVDLDFDRKQTDVNELMVLDSLVDACNAAILGYPTTVRCVRPTRGAFHFGRSDFFPDKKRETVITKCHGIG